MLPFKIQSGKSTYISKDLKIFLDIILNFEDIYAKFYNIIFKKLIFIKICSII